MSDYNYERFDASYYEFTAFPGPEVGDVLPDITLTTLDGEMVSLSGYRGEQLVIETGSVTCPMYAKDVKPMKAVVAAHPDTAFVVMYIREAHPGTKIKTHHTETDKLACASQVSQTLDEGRTVLVDDVAGTAHQLLGSFPNMVYIIDESGVVTWRTNWSDTKTVAAVLNGTATALQLSQDIVPPTKPTPWLAAQVLLRAGFGALVDFVKSLPALIRSHRQVKKDNDRRESDG